MIRTLIFAVLITPMVADIALAEVQLKPVQYSDGSTTFQGFVAMPVLTGMDVRPGVVIFSDWMGVGDFSKERARRLAEAGYIALAADVYGEGKRAADPKEAAALAGELKGDRATFRRRAEAALSALRKTPGVDSSKLAAIGFCFGGTAALELARDGAPLQGVVSFHGGLDTPDPSMAKNIKAKLLVLHGADDTLVPEQQVKAFEDEMRQANVDWQLVKYSGAVHAFTNPEAGTDKAKGIAYDEVADARSYRAMTSFFEEIFRK